MMYTIAKKDSDHDGSKQTQFLPTFIIIIIIFLGGGRGAEGLKRERER